MNFVVSNHKMLKMKNQQRRDFIKTGTLISGAILSSAFVSEDNKMNLNNSGMKNSEKRILGSGNNSIEVSSLGLGCMGMSFNRSFIPERKYMVDVIRKAYDLGVTFYDTAEVYGPFTNETLVGEAIKPFRKKIILCSKFGFDIQDNKMTGKLNSHPKHIREVVEASLKRLNTDVIDLLYQHRVDPNIPVEDVAGTVKDLIKEGKVKHYGMSEANEDQIRRSHKIQPLTALQSEYSLLTREPESTVFPVCEELGIGFVPYSPLSRGYLTGYINERTKYNPANDNRPSLPRYQPEAVIANWKFIDILTEFGNQRGYTAGQVALAWLMVQKPWIVPIPGTTKIAHLYENCAVANIEFSKDELQKLTTDLSKIPVAGSRNAPPQAK
jgi:aryl-alcohol dehydrogenase-like predicted oxidoreductase